MTISRFLMGLAFIIALLCSVTANAETAQQAFTNGNALLAEGDFQQALQAYSSAVRAERTNQEYRQKFMLVRRVITLRENLSQEKDPQRWVRIAQSLRSFYLQHGIHSEALSVDEKYHAKLNTALSAGQLAETHLAMGNSDQAAQVLSSLPAEKATTFTRALLAIALARQGQIDEARRVSETIARQDRSDPGILYVLARMQARIGNHSESLELLTRCLEAVPPSRLDDLTKHARQSPEFAALVSTDNFAMALQTKSKVVESKCSGGSSCAGCPMRGNCAKSHGK